MNVFKLLVPYFIAIICELNHGAYSMKHLGEWQNFVRDVRHGKNQMLDERLSAHTDATENIRRKRSVDQTEPLPAQECTKGLYNCAGTYHCPNGHTIPLQEVCDNKSQCLDSDDESACVHPCQPICMCIGLTVKFSDPFLATARFPSNTTWNNLLSPGLQQLSKISYLVIEDKYNVYKTFSKGLQSLRSLDLSNNSIVLLPKGVFGEMSSIVHLDLSYNKINQLSIDTFHGLTDLVYLDLSNNQISVLPVSVFSGLPNLILLDLSSNHISVLPDSVFSGLPNLISLNLPNNQISVLPDSVFSGLANLIRLDLSNNQISALPDSVFSGPPILIHLDLSNNQISVLPMLPASFKWLDISYNNFASLPAGTFTNSSNLSALNIIGNKLEVKQHMFEGLENLTFLLTDTPFMCCVKPKSVTDDKCVNNWIRFENCMLEKSACKSGDVISSCKNLIGSDLLRFFLWIIGFCSLIGNFTVMFYRLLIDRDNITTSYSIFVLNLSMSDLLMSIYLMIIGSFDIHYRDVYAWNDQDWRSSIVCTIAGILSNISSEMSTFLILMVTIDRVIVIVFPMSRLSRRNISGNQACLISLFLWLVAITVAVIPVVTMQFYFKGKYYSQSGVCLALPLTHDEQPGSGYSFAVFVCLNSFIFVIIAIGQLRMFKSLVTSGGGRVASSQTRQRDLTVARTLFLVVATDFCCWFPIGVMGVMSKSGYEIPNDVYAWVMVFVLPVNAAINPFLYTVSAIWRKRQSVR
ncbi:G-protein coupled receptor GRL101-like [Ylistrum balloti]|uniref:G-protein coupled receptor GRL101-like n=1 Tax=Ylistrum balloti TaxID=509963 RepID=UPI002905837E|nr:G-protein coupled receptor GRL101-like [Ylistrum balloti]